MLINRNDGVVNLCEMKFSREPYELTLDELARMQRRRKVFKDETGTRKAVPLTLVVSPELKKNAYANDIQSTVTLDDLFRLRPWLSSFPGCSTSRSLSVAFAPLSLRY